MDGLTRKPTNWPATRFHVNHIRNACWNSMHLGLSTDFSVLPGKRKKLNSIGFPELRRFLSFWIFLKIEQAFTENCLLFTNCSLLVGHLAFVLSARWQLQFTAIRFYSVFGSISCRVFTLDEVHAQLIREDEDDFFLGSEARLNDNFGDSNSE